MLIPVLVCVHAPIETEEENMKDVFYEDLSQIYDKLPGNVIKLVIGDLNAKCGKETHFIPMIGREKLHETSNENEYILRSRKRYNNKQHNFSTQNHT